MSSDTKWIVGTGIGIVLAILTTGVGLAALMISLITGMNSRIDDVSTRIDDVRGELRGFRTEVNVRIESFDTRLRSVEVAFGKVDQRLLTIERFVLPTPEQPRESSFTGAGEKIREVVCRIGGHLPMRRAWLGRTADAAVRERPGERRTRGSALRNSSGRSPS